MTFSNSVCKSLFFFFFIILVILSSGCVAPEPRTVYSYSASIEIEGDAQNITLIVPMPYYKGEVYSEIITDPENSEDIGDDNISYEIIDTKYGNMLRIQSPKNGSFVFKRYGDRYPVNNTPWISGDDPVLYPRFNQTPVTIERKPGEAYRTKLYTSFDGGTNSGLRISVSLRGTTTLYESRRYCDGVICDGVINEIIPHNASGEWIWVNGYSGWHISECSISKSTPPKKT